MRLVPLEPMRMPNGGNPFCSAAEIRQVGADSDGPSLAECTVVFDTKARNSICNAAVARALGQELREVTEAQVFPVQLSLGQGPDGPVVAEVMAYGGGSEAFEGLGLGGDRPAVVLGPDVLCRRRLILCPRRGSSLGCQQ
ncbi:unnamed protein product [Prorocentrum cordatum]|uniref:Uncharacterized protein n=1 Tax=Prorocentrum cordatum TaxID=2364126 RepID=A0ABN9UH40_9DINO|nr:unnamed protein product [Polarella glacialis]